MKARNRTIQELNNEGDRSVTDTRAVRKNVSLPAWMANLADKHRINCSQVLQEGLRKQFDTL